jgi:hypothetical protein
MDTICGEHLTNVKDTIKCSKCKQLFHLNTNYLTKFETNNTLKKLLDDEVYLSDGEKTLKTSLFATFNEFSQLYAEFHTYTNKLDLELHEHFQEIRFKIDLHREKLKEKIDEIYIDMIEKTKRIEMSYAKNLDTNRTCYARLDLDKERQRIDNEFREPNLTMALIEQMQFEQSVLTTDLKARLDKMFQTKEFIKTNTFKPAYTLNINSFGILSIDDFSNSLQQSEILNPTLNQQLVNVCEFNPNEKWHLLYRGSRDGFEARDFHTKCDGHSRTLTLCKAFNSGYIFGGYTNVCWSSSNQYKADSDAFIFSLTNKDQSPCKIRVDSKCVQYAICCHREYGPTFGQGHDLHIANEANRMGDDTACHSNLCQTYKHHLYKVGSNEALAFLAGSYKFRLSEIEIYTKD